MTDRDREELFNEFWVILKYSDVEIDSLSDDSYESDIRSFKRQICGTYCYHYM